jgi:hypothetical protein
MCHEEEYQRNYVFFFFDVCLADGGGDLLHNLPRLSRRGVPTNNEGNVCGWDRDQKGFGKGFQNGTKKQYHNRKSTVQNPSKNGFWTTFQTTFWITIPTTINIINTIIESATIGPLP